MQSIDVIVRDVMTVHSDTDLAESVKHLAEHDVSAFPVVLTRVADEMMAT